MNIMKKLHFKIIFLALVLLFPVIAMAMGRVDVGVRVPLPPAIVISGSPNLVVIPETYVYADPDLDVDIFFYQGWWWRPWEGRWYRSRDYRKGWNYYQQTPSFYRQIPQDWRNSYRERRWKENQWEQQRIPHRKVQKNWKTWERSRYWENHNNWGVKKPESRSDPRQQKQGIKRDSRGESRDEDNSDDSRDRNKKNDKKEKEKHNR
jgi:hypothetical protein